MNGWKDIVTPPLFFTILLWSGFFSLLSKLIHIFYFYSTWWFHLSQFFITSIECIAHIQGYGKAYMWSWRTKLLELFLLLHHVDSWDGVQVLRIGGKCLYILKHLSAHPNQDFYVNQTSYYQGWRGSLAVENPWWMWVQLLTSTSHILFYNFSSQGYNTSSDHYKHCAHVHKPTNRHIHIHTLKQKSFVRVLHSGDNGVHLWII